MNRFEREALFECTLSGGDDSDAAWDAVATLRRDGDRDTFDRAVAWTASNDPNKRARGLDVLCQLQASAPHSKTGPQWLFRGEACAVSKAVLVREGHPLVLTSAIQALGQMGDEESIPLLARHAGHLDQSVRLAVAAALGSLPNSPESTACLLKLTSDADAQVRDWAVFGLGVQGDADSAEIRDSLLLCLNDESEDVREEAAVGLARRRDARLLPQLRVMLDAEGLKVRVAQAAAALLGLQRDPEHWQAADYRAALDREFGPAAESPDQANNSFTTLPCTSVRRKSRPMCR